MIYTKIAIFNWDLIISNPIHKNYCLLNSNFSKKIIEQIDEEPDSDYEENIFIQLPPKIKGTDGQSTSKSY